MGSYDSRAPLTYHGAKQMMTTARDPANGKPLQNNTRLYERREGFAVQLHATDVVTILPNGRFRISTGGWDTVTTWNRIYGWSPLGWMSMVSHQVRERFGGSTLKYRQKRVYATLTERDPAPDVPTVDIARPFRASDPGPEPVKSNDGCWAGHRHVTGHYGRVMIHVNELRDSDVYEPPSFYWKRSGIRSRDVTAYLRAVERDATGYVHVTRHHVTVVDYGAEASFWEYERAGKVEAFDRTQNYTQCPHCAEFAKRHRTWSDRYHGSRWGARSGRGWRLYCELVEEFGGVEAWREEYLRQYRARRAALKTWTEWMLRNTIEFHDGIVVNEQGRVSRRYLEQWHRDERRAKRLAVKRERELERQRREQARDHRLWEKRQAQLQTNRRKAYRDTWPAAHGLDNETLDWLISNEQPPAPHIIMRRPYR